MLITIPGYKKLSNELKTNNTQENILKQISTRNSIIIDICSSVLPNEDEEHSLTVRIYRRMFFVIRGLQCLASY